MSIINRDNFTKFGLQTANGLHTSGLRYHFHFKPHFWRRLNVFLRSIPGTILCY